MEMGSPKANRIMRITQCNLVVCLAANLSIRGSTSSELYEPCAEHRAAPLFRYSHGYQMAQRPWDGRASVAVKPPAAIRSARSRPNCA